MQIRLRKQSFLNCLDSLLYKLWFNLWIESCDKAASSLIQLDHEKNSTIKTVFTFFFFGILSILTTPIGITFYLLWFVLFRNIFRSSPYRLSVNHALNDDLSELRIEKHLEILSMNVCLLPETASKINNLSQTRTRANLIGAMLTADSYAKQTNHKVTNKNENNIRIIHDLMENNTDYDFVCLQEVWSIEMGKRLCEKMHKKYKYVCYDAENNTFHLNKCVGLGSGLFLASKFPIVACNFKQFTNKTGMCSWAGKGLLTCKVLLGGKHSINGKELIGYISTTHLQSYQKDNTLIHSRQLDQIQSWIKIFKDSTHNQKNEHISFDIITGDFNIDNISPADQTSFHHNLWTQYVDPLAIKPGVDHPLAIGTEMRYFGVQHQQYTSSPKAFKDALECERKRRFLILDANIKYSCSEMVKENPELDADGLPKLLKNDGGRRRVDRILFCENHNINLIEYNFLASFVRLVDHIPIAIKFNCDL